MNINPTIKQAVPNGLTCHFSGHDCQRVDRYMESGRAFCNLFDRILQNASDGKCIKCDECIKACVEEMREKR